VPLYELPNLEVEEVIPPDLYELDVAGDDVEGVLLLESGLLKLEYRDVAGDLVLLLELVAATIWNFLEEVPFGVMDDSDLRDGGCKDDDGTVG